MTPTLRTLLATLALAAASGAWAQTSPTGLWKTIDDDGKTAKSLVRISESGGVYTGKIEKILDPAKAKEVCSECKDDRKNQPLEGLTILTGIKQDAEDKGLFDGGEITDPKNGKSYKARLKPVDGGAKLEVRGYIGAPLFGRTQTWIRVE